MPKLDEARYYGTRHRHVVIGAYFGWPWWRRRLSDVVAVLYPWVASWVLYAVYRGRVDPRYRTHTRLALQSVHRSKVKPIFWAVEWQWNDGSWQRHPSPEHVAEMKQRFGGGLA